MTNRMSRTVIAGAIGALAVLVVWISWPGRDAVPLEEPSGMSASSVDGQLWLVSDAGPDIALIDAGGSVVRRLSVDVADSDWEGIVELDNGHLLVAEERRYQLLEIDPDTATIVAIHQLANMVGFDEIADVISDSKKNKGLEGITLDPEGRIWVVKESDPALLIEIDASLSRIVSWVDPTPALSAELDIHAGDIDLTGLAPYPDLDRLWLLSHEAAAVFVWNTATTEVERTVRLDLDKPEGIAATSDGALVIDENGGELVTVDS